MITNFDVASALTMMTPFHTVLSGDLAVLPLFMLVGSFAIAGGVATEAFEVGRRWLGQLPGGLALATIAGSAAFAACSGSSMANAVALGKMAVPEMRRYGYSTSLSTGACAAGGLLATMIPPSNSLAIYGIIAEESIGHLLIAGLFPGLLIALFFGIGLYVLTRLNPKAAPISPIRFTWKERFTGIFKIWGVVLIFCTIFFGIFLGIFTATEAGAFGAFVSLVVLFKKQKGKSWSAVITACRECAAITGMILFLIFGALVFSAFVIQAGLPRQLSETVYALGMTPIAVIVMMVVSYVILGMFLDGAAMMLITVPIYLPVVIALGYDGIWFGILLVMMVEIGTLTPPFGLLIFVLSSVVPDVPISTIFRGSIMFVFLELAVVILIIAFPEIALWLPSQMMG